MACSDGEKRLMKKQTRMSAPLLNLEPSQRLLSATSHFPLPSSHFSVPPWSILLLTDIGDTHT